VRAVVGPDGAPPAESAAAAERLNRVARANTAAMFAYAPGPYAGRLLFFRAATRRPGEPRHPERAWLDLAAGGVDFHVVPGDHETLLRPPGVDLIADRLRAALAARPSEAGPDRPADGGPVSRLSTGPAPRGKSLDL
jgi:thioesterase domain-containing protein